MKLEQFSDNCPFCGLIRRKAGMLGEMIDVGIYLFEPLNPVVPGHKLFITREHFSSSVYSPAMTGLIFGQATIYGRDRREDFNLILNDGSDAGQTVGHVHVHYVPRHKDDGLIMPWTAQQKEREEQDKIGYRNGFTPYA